MNERDDLFKNLALPKFEFNQDVARVFDDMVARSVPLYEELQRLTAEVCKRFYQPPKIIYDLGASTATTLHFLAKAFSNEPFIYVGMDNSQAMLEKAQEKMPSLQKNQSAKFILQDISSASYPNASVILANYTLQFIEPLRRKQVLKQIADSLLEDSIFLMSEKVKEESSEITNFFMELHFHFKRFHGYSDLEIARKRDALENVLIPFSTEEYHELLKSCGFREVIILLKWCNFATFLCRK